MCAGSDIPAGRTITDPVISYTSKLHDSQFLPRQLRHVGSQVGVVRAEGQRVSLWSDGAAATDPTRYVDDAVSF